MAYLLFEDYAPFIDEMHFPMLKKVIDPPFSTHND